MRVNESLKCDIMVSRKIRSGASSVGNLDENYILCFGDGVNYIYSVVRQE